MMKRLLILAVLAQISTWSQDATPESLRQEIESLKVDAVAWRGIPWRTCLLEALKTSRETSKPVLAWVFIDRPVNDKRC